MITPTVQDDKLLFESIARGEEPGFRIFFERYKEKVYHFVYALVKSGADAEELVQDVFFRLWLSRHVLSAVENPSNYLYVMARNRAMDHIRRMASDRKMRVELNRAGEGMTSTEEVLAFKESRKLLEEAVRKLPAQQQKVYLLSKESGLSREQIAAALEISPNTVKNHLADAMARIRQAMMGADPIILLILLSPITGK